MSIYDMYDTYKVLVDPCKSGAEKAMAVGLFAAGLVGPGAGYGVIGRKIAGAVNGLRKKCPNSFDEETLVQTDEGLKPIAEIEVGDKVLARNELTGQESYQTVTATMAEWHDTTLTVNLWRAEGSEQIITTDEHPFFVVGKGFTPAAKLVLGDVIKLAGERLSVVGNLKRNFKGQLAYNLTVANDHTYFVGQSRAWVHNECIRPFALGLSDHLDDFARTRGADTWKNLPDPMRWRSGVLDALANPQRTVHFNLDGVDNVWSSVSRASSGRGGATDWELLQVQQNREFWSTTEFWRNGQRVGNPFGE
jgi:Pretoxin HINT domain